MIPMSCPKCGKRGSVPPDRLGTRMSCRSCKAVFHMDQSGHIVLGEPVDENDTSKKRKKPKCPKGQREQIDLGFSDMLKTTPKPVKIAIGVVVVLLVPYMLGFRPNFWVPIPDTLEGRAEYVASAFADDAAGRARKIASSGTAADIDAWFEKARPMFKYRPQTNSSNRVMMLPVANKTEGDTAKVVMKLIPPNRNRPTSPGRASRKRRSDMTPKAFSNCRSTSPRKAPSGCSTARSAFKTCRNPRPQSERGARSGVYGNLLPGLGQKSWVLTRKKLDWTKVVK